MGYVTLDRKIFGNFLWVEKRPYSKFEAWLDLIQLVSFKNENKQLINGKLVKWGRGQYPVSRSFLSARWHWSDNRVRSYITLLSKERMITYKTTKKSTILTLCNYESYNLQQPTEGPTEGPTDNQPKDQLTTIIKEGNTIKKEKKDKKKKLPDKPADTLDRIISDFVLAHGSYEVINRGKERAAAGKLLQQYKKKYPESNTEETIEALQKYFRACVKIEDSWLRDNMSLSIIVSKFNEINNILRNGKHKQSGTSDIEFRNFFARTYGVDAQVQ